MRFSELSEAARPKGILPVTPPNIQLAKAFVYRKWVEREKEDHDWLQGIRTKQGYGDNEEFVAPVDLSNGCKFSSYFCSIVFGGRMVGNYDHYFVILPDGSRLDLNDDAADVVDMLEKSTGEADHPYRVDDLFMARALKSDRRNVSKRVTEWLNAFCQENGLEARFVRTSSGAIKEIP